MGRGKKGKLMRTPADGRDRFSRDRPRFTDTLNIIKFLCKDMWTLVFRKQIDNLKTNHRVGSLNPIPLYLCENLFGILLTRFSGYLRPHGQQF